MTLADRLGYRHPSARSVRARARGVAGTPLGARLLRVILRPLDAAVGAVTRGRTSLTTLVTGIPVIQLATTGVRSGQARATTLLAVPHRDGLVVVGSNFGARTTPAWARNLAARPDAMVHHGRRSARVHARPLEGEEADAAFDAACHVYPAFASYVARARREVPLFLLTARDDAL